VTLQVALIGTDGIVLASDRRAVDSFHQIQTTSLTTKTIIRPDYKMAVAFSGNLKLSGAVAGKVIDSEFIIDPEKQRREIEDLAREVCERDEDYRDSSQDGEVLIVSVYGSRALHTLQLNPKYPKLSQIFDKTVAGLMANTACFFAERYYRNSLVDDLVFLAAHTILQASKLDEKRIKGLEIITCTDNRIRRLPEDRIANLTARSEALDAKIQAGLLGQP
jgi:hypothetical protein